MAALQVGGHYRLLKKIGAGSFGDIYLGTDLEVGPNFGEVSFGETCTYR